MKSFANWCIAVLATAVSAEVHVLTKDNFDSFIAENKHALVEFYAPWCGHCKKLEPEYEKAAEALEGKVKLGKVDATTENDVASKFEVKGYPTLKWFINGEATEYDGGRTADTIVEWVTAMTGPAVVETDAPLAPVAGKPAVILYGSELTSAFSSAAATMRKKASFYFVKSSKSKLTMQHTGEDVLELASGINSDSSIKEFITKNALPLFGALNGDTFSMYMESGSGLVWSLFPMSEGDKIEEVVTEHREMMTKVAKEFAGKFSITYTDTIQFKDAVQSMLGVSEFPAIVVQKKAGDKKKFVFDGKLDAASISQYIKDVDSGKIVAKLKSEPVPEEPQQEAVKVVVADTLEKIVFDAERDVLFEIYAPWCGHCKKLEPEFEKIGKKIQKDGFDDIITISKMDGTANDSPVESIDWEGFPTLYYIKAGSSTPEKYEGGRTAKDIWKWIKKNHSKADTIKERLAAKKSSKESDKEEL